MIPMPGEPDTTRTHGRPHNPRGLLMAPQGAASRVFEPRFHQPHCKDPRVLLLGPLWIPALDPESTLVNSLILCHAVKLPPKAERGPLARQMMVMPKRSIMAAAPPETLSSCNLPEAERKVQPSAFCVSSFSDSGRPPQFHACFREVGGFGAVLRRFPAISERLGVSGSGRLSCEVSCAVLCCVCVCILRLHIRTGHTSVQNAL